MEQLSFNAVETLLGFGAGCGAGYGFALRVIVPAMLAAKVAPLEVKQEALEKEIADLGTRLDAEVAFNLSLQQKLFGVEGDKEG